MPDISAIQNTPDVSFIDNKTIDDVRGDMVADFEAFMLQATGSKVSLGRASVHRMILYSAAAQIYQAMQYVDRAGKQSLLKYSYSEFLDNLALLKGVTREPAKAATTTIRFTASATRTLATPIPAGTRVSSSGSIYFSTMEYAEIPAGSLTVDVLAECTATGNAGNGLAPGEVSTIVDPVPYITSAVNQNTTEGGADVDQPEPQARPDAAEYPHAQHADEEHGVGVVAEGEEPFRLLTGQGAGGVQLRRRAGADGVAPHQPQHQRSAAGAGDPEQRLHQPRQPGGGQLPEPQSQQR